MDRGARACHAPDRDASRSPAAANSEVKILVAQQPKMMAANLIGLTQDPGYLLGQMFAKQFRALKLSLPEKKN